MPKMTDEGVQFFSSGSGCRVVIRRISLASSIQKPKKPHGSRGRKFSSEHVEKIRAAVKATWTKEKKEKFKRLAVNNEKFTTEGMKMPSESVERRAQKLRGVARKVEHIAKMEETHRALWKDYTPKDNSRNSSRYKRWRKRVLERDSYTCQHCGSKPEEVRKLHSHHIQGWEEAPSLRYEESNGLTLCDSCHRKHELIVQNLLVNRCISLC